MTIRSCNVCFIPLVLRDRLRQTSLAAHMPRFLALLSLLLGVFAAVPSVAETNATDDVAQFVANPKFTPQQLSLLREMAQDPYLDGKVASFFGLNAIRFSNQARDTQACLVAQYILFQDISRSKPSTKVLQFARENLARMDWCSPVVSALTGQSVSQVLAYDGLASLYYVLSRDMALRVKPL